MSIKETIYRITTSQSVVAIMTSLTLLGLGLAADFALTQYTPQEASQPPLIMPDLPQIPLAH